MPRMKVLMLSLATLCASAFGQNANPARPGTLNYIEGQASIEGRPLTPHSIGTTELEAGQYLATAKGKAEILLTPGVFLRVAEDSTDQDDLTRPHAYRDPSRAGARRRRGRPTLSPEPSPRRHEERPGSPSQERPLHLRRHHQRPSASSTAKPPSTPARTSRPTSSPST